MGNTFSTSGTSAHRHCLGETDDLHFRVWGILTLRITSEFSMHSKSEEASLLRGDISLVGEVSSRSLFEEWEGGVTLVAQFIVWPLTAEAFLFLLGFRGHSLWLVGDVMWNYTYTAFDQQELWNHGFPQPWCWYHNHAGFFFVFWPILNELFALWLSPFFWKPIYAFYPCWLFPGPLSKMGNFKRLVVLYTSCSGRGLGL